MFFLIFILCISLFLLPTFFTAIPMLFCSCAIRAPRVVTSPVRQPGVQTRTTAGNHGYLFIIIILYQQSTFFFVFYKGHELSCT